MPSCCSHHCDHTVCRGHCQACVSPMCTISITIVIPRPSSLAWSSSSHHITPSPCGHPMCSLLPSPCTVPSHPSLLPGPSPAQAQRECVVCMDAPCNTRLRPCMHSLLCEECAEVLVVRRQLCPTCRASIERFDVGEFSTTFAE